MRGVALSAVLLWAFLMPEACAVEPDVDLEAGTVVIAAVVAKQGKYEVLKGAIEYMLVSEHGKDYESVFITPVKPEAIVESLVKLGIASAKPAADEQAAQERLIDVDVEYESDGKKVRRPASEFVIYTKTGKPMSDGPWVYTGSKVVLDPATDRQRLEAAVTGNVLGLHVLDASVLIQNPRAEAADENIYKANVDLLPKAGTAVRIILSRAKPVPGMRRAHVFLSGRVQGVGFRAFTQRKALPLDVTGWVRNLKDGRVEAVIEGPDQKVAKLLSHLARGPRGARVEKTDIQDGLYRGQFRTFAVKWQAE